MFSPVWRQLMHPFVPVVSQVAQAPYKRRALNPLALRSPASTSSTPAAPQERESPGSPQAKEDRSLLGRVLKAYRKEHHLTQEQLASVLLVEPRTLRCWENERHTSNIHELHRIADLLDIAPERLGVVSRHSPLRAHRQLRGWSQQRLAEQIGAYPTMVSRWEGGVRKPSPYYQEQLCLLFETTADKLGFL